eukprot:Selendium_serpulae@DN9125_c0_g1_i1.p1
MASLKKCHTAELDSRGAQQTSHELFTASASSGLHPSLHSTGTRGQFGRSMSLPVRLDDLVAPRVDEQLATWPPPLWKGCSGEKPSTDLSQSRTSSSSSPHVPPVCAPSVSSFKGQRLAIAMVCDFFYPRLGGVEMHIFELSLCLMELGFKVIVITHSSEGRQGVRYMTKGLKVYYIPMLPFHDNCTLPTFFSAFAMVRQILIREAIDVVHGHQATSNLAHETIFHSRTMGFKTLYTDHSNFGFADAACIHINKLLSITLQDIDAAICVSHTNKLNLCLRAAVPFQDVFVIPNAVCAMRFRPSAATLRRRSALVEKLRRHRQKKKKKKKKSTLR